MVNSLLYRWEDSPALQHHCGFCDRPLSHPGARSSCFGPHSEPCHRYHQAMFMRGRAHICNYCNTADEAHHKRHSEIVTQLRSIYESCGEDDWTIVPSDPGDLRRGRSSERPHEDTLPAVSKRERKDAKCLARAASRAKFVTQDEIAHIHSVLHVAETSSASDASPTSIEEIQLIEEHLRYNANVYNSQSSRRDLRIFATIPDVDLDFDAEMERVLDAFRVTELVKRNFRNRGLQGKDLKAFEMLVEIFKSLIVEDLVLVKKDAMEVRMRRAGYLRYANKSSYDIVQERYTEKNWKTGQRITSVASESSDLTSPSEDSYTSIDTPSEVAVQSSIEGPDRRHLQQSHTRVNGDDGLGQTTIEPYHTPLLNLTPCPTPKKHTVLQLRLVENKENRVHAGKTSRGWSRRATAKEMLPDQPFSTPDDQAEPEPSRPVKPVPSVKLNPGTKSAWADISATGRNSKEKNSRLSGDDFPSLRRLPKILATVSNDLNKSPSRSSTKTSTEIDTEYTTASIVGTPNAHPVVSQKKAKKAQREAKRKAKKVSDPEETPDSPADKKVDPTIDGQASLQILSSDLGVSEAQGAAGDASDNRSAPSAPKLMNIDEDEPIVVAASQDAGPRPPINYSLLRVPYTSHAKHDHWLRHSRTFEVDQLTLPHLKAFESCAHGSSCRFEGRGVLDCPFHEPHCDCVDPLTNQCYLVHPGKEVCAVGPYNRAHGERLLTVYEHHDRTKGRVMLVDDDLLDYFTSLVGSPSKPDLMSVPSRLAHEHDEFLDGFERGPLMKQELHFQQLLAKNLVMRHPLDMSTLQAFQQESSGLSGSIKLCYCQVEVSQDVDEVCKEFNKGYVRCSYAKCKFGNIFHKNCVKKLGTERVSRWYCTLCEKQMKINAQEVLGVPFDVEGLALSAAEKTTAKEIIAEMSKADSHVGQFVSRLRTAFDREFGSGNVV